MKNKKVLGGAIAIIAAIIVLLVTILAINAGKKRVALSPEEKRVMAYNQLSDADMVANNCEYVKFGAYFAQDLNKDGRAEKVLGSCKQIGQTNTLFFDLSVSSNGYLENGKIEITNANFTNKMTAIKDSVLKQNYVSDNVRTIEFNRIDAGTNEFLSGIISAAIQNGGTDYSKVVSVRLTGTHHTDPDRSGNVTETAIDKTIELTIDWYGEAEAEVRGDYKKLYLEDYSKTFIEQVSTYEEKERTIKFSVATKELKRQLIIKKNDVTVEFPMLYGNYPTSVNVIGGTYNAETHIATVKYMNGAYSNDIEITCVYPQDSYNELKEGDTISFKVTSKYECFNNPNDEFDNPYITNVAEDYANVYFTIYTPPEDNEGIRCSTAILDKEKIDGYYYLSKQNILDSYDTADEDEIENMKYSVEWDTTLKTSGAPNTYPITIKGDDAGNGDLIDGAVMDGYIINKGIYFQNAGLVSEKAKLKIINDETNEVIKEFTSAELREYTKINPYIYDTPVKRIRAEIERMEPEEGELGEDKIGMYNERNNFMTSWSVIRPRNVKELYVDYQDGIYFNNPAAFGLTEENKVILRKMSTDDIIKEFTYDEMLTYNSASNYYQLGVGFRFEVTGSIKNAIRFTNVANIPEDYVLEMIDYQAGSIIKTFNHNDMETYSYDKDLGTLTKAEKDDLWINPKSNIFYFDNDGRYIVYKSYRKVEKDGTTQNIEVPRNSYELKIVNLREIDSKEVKANYTKEQVNAFTQLYTSMKAKFSLMDGGMVDDDSVKLSENKNAVKLLISEADKKIDVTAANEFEKTLSIYLPNDSTSQKWKNGIFLIALPKEFIGVNVESITTSNDGIKVEGSDVYKKGECYYIKVITSNEEPTNGVTIRIRANMQINPMASAAYIRADLYAYNEAHNVYQTPVSDFYDINGNEDVGEDVGYSKEYFNVLAPTAFATVETISDYDDDESITVAPNVAEIISGRTTAKVNIHVANNYSSKVSNMVILGRVPVEGSLDSEFSVQMINGGISIPGPLVNKVTCYYSEKIDATNDLTDASNGWKNENVDISKVKSYLIVVNDTDLNTGDRYDFDYDISIPSNVEINKKAFGNHTVYFRLYAGENNSYLERELSPRKVGIRIVKYFDFEITKLKNRTTLPVQGAKYLLKEVNEPAEEKELNRILISNAEGKIALDNLRVNQEYSFKEIQAPADYELNEDEIRFKVVEVNGELSIVYTTEKTFGDGASITDNKLTANIYETPKVKLIINKKDSETNAALNNVVFKINGKSYTTKEGQIVVTGLSLGQANTIEETYAKGYIREPEFTFTINQDGSGNITVDSENNAFANPTATVDPEDSNLIVVTVDFPNEKIETYTLEIEKVDETDETKKLKDAEFLLKQIDLGNSIYYTTNEQGKITIPNLYVHVSGRETVTGKYTIKETIAPAGYTDNHEEIEFVTSKNSEGKLVVEVTNEAAMGTLKEAKVDNENKKVTLVIQNKPMFKVTKVETIIEDNKTLANKNFVIYKLQNDGVTTDGFAKNSSDQFIGTKNANDNYYVTSNDNGVISVENLPAGKYLIQEFDYVEGRSELDNSKTVELSDLAETYTVTMTGKLAKKTPLSNVGFVIYELDQNGEILDYAKDGNDNYVGKQNNNGDYILLTNILGELTAGLRNGTYKIMEVQFLDGYKIIDNSEVFTIAANKKEDHYYPVEFPTYDSSEPQITTTGTLRIDSIEDWIRFARNINGEDDGSVDYSKALVTLERDLDFNDTTAWTASTETTQGTGSYKNPNSTEFGDINGDGVTEGIKEELTKEEGLGCPSVGLSRVEYGETGTKGFRGVFDGKNHKIKNLYINRDSEYAGLFGYSGSSSDSAENGAWIVIKNVTVGGTVKGYYAGGIIAYASNHNIYMENVTNECNCDSDSSYSGGGLIAYSEGDDTKIIIKSSINKGVIKNSGSYVGGFVGYTLGASTVIENSKNYGNITGSSSASGFADYVSKKITIVDCYNGPNPNEVNNENQKGIVTGNSDYTGGFVGQGWKDTNIKGCHNKGEIHGSSYVGGIAAYNSSALIICDSYNEADIYATSACCGGIIGNLYGSSCTIANCYNTGNIIGQDYAYSVGGIVGQNSVSNSTIANCYNIGSVQGNYWLGGIIGNASSSGTRFTDCYNTGSINQKQGANYYSAGIAGGSGTISAERCYNAGNINAIVDYSDACLCGIAQSASTLKDCYNTGNITGQSKSMYSGNADVYGLVNTCNKLENCYNTGNITAIGCNSYAHAYAAGVSGFGKICENCYNTGIITAKGNLVYAGGIIAYGSSGNYAKGCYNTGKIKAEFTSDTGKVAGISAGDAGLTVEESYNIGDIEIKTAKTGCSIYAAGIACGGSVQKSYNTGNVTCNFSEDSNTNNKKLYMGGIISTGAASVCYNSGDMNINDKSENITYSLYVGGTVGTGSVTDSYSTGNIYNNIKVPTGTTWAVGPLCGSATKNNAYYLGNSQLISSRIMDQSQCAISSAQLKSDEYFYKLGGADKGWVKVPGSYPKLNIGSVSSARKVTEIEFNNERETYDITTEIGVNKSGLASGGTITGEYNEKYQAGSNRKFVKTLAYGGSLPAENAITITPSAEYMISSIKINGENEPFTVENGQAYTIPVSRFADVRENMNVVVTFEEMKYVLTVNKENESHEKLEGVEFSIDQVEDRAEIGSEYKEKVDSAAVKVPDYENEITTAGVVGAIVQQQGFSFAKDGDGKYVPNNNGIQDTTADSYVEIDLSALDSATNYQVTINAEHAGEYNDYGYMYLTDSQTTPTMSSSIYNGTENRIAYVSGNSASKDYNSQWIKGGKKYYLHVRNEVRTGNGSFIINRINVSKISLTQYQDYNSYSVVSSSNLNPNYTLLGLTIPSGSDQYVLYVKAKNTSTNNNVNEKGYATITRTSTSRCPSASQTDGQIFCMNGTQSSQEYWFTKLYQGENNKLWMCYYRSDFNHTDDKLELESIIVYKAVKEPVTCTIGDPIKTSVDYQFAAQANGSYVANNDASISRADAYVPINLTGLYGEYNVVINATTSGYNQYAIIDESASIPTTLSSSSDNNVMCYTSSHSEITGNYISKVLEGNKQYYLHLINYNNDGSANFALNSVKVYKVKEQSLHFNKDSNGVYTSNNQTFGNTIAHSYVPIDLTATRGFYNIIVNAQISSSAEDYGYVYITQSTDMPTISSGTNRLVNISGEQAAADYVKKVEAGDEKIYYVHMIYKKDITKDAGTDTFTINSITLEYNQDDFYHESGIKTDANGQFRRSLPFGKYKITETEPLDGYNAVEPVTHIIGEGTNNNITITNERSKQVITHYVEDSTDEPLAENEVQNVSVNAKYRTTPKLAIGKYNLKKNAETQEYVIPDNASGTMGTTDINVTYRYEMLEYDYKIKFFYNGTEAPLEEIPGKAEAGKVITYNPEEKDGYVFERAVNSPMTITDNADDNVMEIHYATQYTITTGVVKHSETAHDNTITNNVKGGTISGEDESPYEVIANGGANTLPIEITPDDGYVIKEVKVNETNIDTSNFIDESTGKVTLPARFFQDIAESKYVTAEFIKKSNVKVQYKVKATETEAESSLYTDETTGNAYVEFTGLEGDSFTAEPKAFAGYKLVTGTVITDQDDVTVTGDSNNVVNGTMYADELVLTYWYKKDMANIIEQHILIKVDGTEQGLTAELTHEGQAGTSDTLNRKTTFADYEAADGPASTDENVIVVGKSENSKEVAYESGKTKIVKFYYKGKAGTVTVHYVEKGNETNNVADPYEMQGKAGETYETSPRTDITGYTWDTVMPSNANGTYKAGNIDVVYSYDRNTYAYTINYRLDGTTKDSVPGTAKFGAQVGFDTTKTYPKSVRTTADDAKITISENEALNVLNVDFVSTFDITTSIEPHAEHYQDGTSADSVEGGTISGKGATPFETVVKGITQASELQPVVITPAEGYEIESIKVNDTAFDFAAAQAADGSVTFTADTLKDITADTHIMAKFKKKSKVIVKYVYMKTFENLYVGEHGETQVEIEGYEGTDYSTVEKSFDGYEFVRIVNTNNEVVEASGTMFADDITIIYLYKREGEDEPEPPTGKVIVKYENSLTGAKVAEPETIEQLVDSTYNTTTLRKTLSGYRLDETKLPANETGSVTEADTIVVYKYIKLKEYDVYVVYEKDGKTVEGFKVKATSDSGVDKEEYVTGGKLNIDRIESTEEGTITYVITEIETPEGYITVLPEDKPGRITIKKTFDEEQNKYLVTAETNGIEGLHVDIDDEYGTVTIHVEAQKKPEEPVPDEPKDEENDDEPESTKTGDKVILYIAIAAVSAIAIIAIVIISKKKKD